MYDKSADEKLTKEFMKKIISRGAVPTKLSYEDEALLIDTILKLQDIVEKQKENDSAA